MTCDGQATLTTSPVSFPDGSHVPSTPIVSSSPASMVDEIGTVGRPVHLASCRRGSAAVGSGRPMRDRTPNPPRREPSTARRLSRRIPRRRAGSSSIPRAGSTRDRDATTSANRSEVGAQWVCVALTTSREASKSGIAERSRSRAGGDELRVHHRLVARNEDRPGPTAFPPGSCSRASAVTPSGSRTDRGHPAVVLAEELRGAPGGDVGGSPPGAQVDRLGVLHARALLFSVHAFEQAAMHGFRVHPDAALLAPLTPSMVE